MKDKFIENGIEYVRQGDYYIPNLTVPNETEYQIGKYGSLRRTFLKEHHNWFYSTMLMQGTLLKHIKRYDVKNGRTRRCYGTVKGNRQNDLGTKNELNQAPSRRFHYA